MRQESNKTLDAHGITVLLDMSTFYDTIDLKRLQETAMDLHYPPLALEFATQVYSGPKAILAEAELSAPGFMSPLACLRDVHKPHSWQKLSYSQSSLLSRPNTPT